MIRFYSNILKTVVVCLLSFSSSFVMAKDTESKNKYDTQAEFPGKFPALIEYLNANIKYPSEAQIKETEGVVMVSFAVYEDGSINEVKVMNNNDQSLEEEAVRVIKSMPNWKPAELNGQKVKSRYVLPVVFKLNKSDKKSSKKKG